MRVRIIIDRDKMIKDLEKCNPQAFKLDDKELEILYNNEFYAGFYGKEYKLK